MEPRTRRAKEAGPRVSKKGRVDALKVVGRGRTRSEEFEGVGVVGRRRRLFVGVEALRVDTLRRGGGVIGGVLQLCELCFFHGSLELLLREILVVESLRALRAQRGRERASVRVRREGRRSNQRHRGLAARTGGRTVDRQGSCNFLFSFSLFIWGLCVSGV